MGQPHCGSFGSGAGAYAAGVEDPSKGADSKVPHSQALPQFPGESALKHVAEKWLETAETTLAGLQGRCTAPIASHGSILRGSQGLQKGAVFT